jgi:DNA-binding CsgD family transcriptional regulator
MHTAEGGSILDHMTDRELQVFQSLGSRLSARGIAPQLHLSVKTIKTDREHLNMKLSSHRR